jgi:hypothetical protein
MMPTTPPMVVYTTAFHSISTPGNKNNTTGADVRAQKR